ncbi:hypothetical protein BB987_05990 [Photorhabdus temperata]|uniref:Uncharacterized protein n=1 Tax=Photorhabdus khanii NC19 TaxID=1004151 RepID=W3VBD8_9GAMM|nr:hypothetical protein PTE_00396 [Photorhabdus khanii NC19]OHV56136.1 hypothetical protein BB987_05990 [Photorhabdus temperata]
MQVRFHLIGATSVHAKLGIIMIMIYINQMILVSLVNNIFIFLLFTNNNNELSYSCYPVN